MLAVHMQIQKNERRKGIRERGEGGEGIEIQERKGGGLIKCAEPLRSSGVHAQVDVGT